MLRYWTAGESHGPALVALVERSCYYAATGVTRADPDALLEAVAAAAHAGICGGIAPDPA